MKTLKKINLRGISEILSEKELKNVLGGSGVWCDDEIYFSWKCYCDESHSTGFFTYATTCDIVGDICTYGCSGSDYCRCEKWSQ